MTAIRDGDGFVRNSDTAEVSTQFVKPSKVPKFFAVDIDGTFYTRKSDELLNNIEAFRRASALGNQLFFCTGRTHFAAAPWMPHDFVAKTGYKGYPGVYCNGGLVFGDDGQVVSRFTFDYEFLKDLLQLIEDANHHQRYIFFSESDSYALVMGDDCTKIHKERYDISYKPTFVTAEQLLQMHDKIACFSVHGGDLSLGFGKYKNNVDYIAKGDEDIVFDVTPIGVTKARGLVAFCHYKGIDPREVGFIGDGLNDVEILQLADLSFAVGNAVDQAKESAKYVLSETCDEGAFAKAMSLVYSV